MLLLSNRLGLVLVSVGDHIGFCRTVLVDMDLAMATSLRAVVMPRPRPWGTQGRG